MENNSNTAMVALDFGAMFDTLNHKIILDGLDKYFGMQVTSLKWIKSYLTNRQFHIQIQKQLS